MKTSIRAASMLLVALSLPALAEEGADTLDEIVVADRSDSANESTNLLERDMLLDTAAALKAIPGANVNSNGLITGIAQYRGMYGDRLAVTIDDHAVVSGGPNAMDTPLSYVSPMITESVAVERGIASVSSAAESIGGHLSARLARGSFGDENFGFSGFVGSRYSANGDLGTSAGRLTLSNSTHRFSVLAELDNGDDIATPVGDIRPSMVDRQRYDFSYAYTDGDSHFVVFAGKLESNDSGTPALPMDIRLIDTSLFGGHFLYALSPKFSVEGRASANDVDHLMDNFALRSAPPPMMQRQTFATGSGRTLALAGRIDLEASTLRIGIEGALADHDAVISNPNDAAFRVLNFHAVERDLASVFAEWLLQRAATDLEFGIRFKQVSTDSGNVGANGIMSPAVAALADAFNSVDRKRSFNDVDAVAKYRHRSGDDIEWHIEIARKSRAPSYQELYLWLPMQSTGGLADGRTYIGDLDLDSEIAHELNVGFDADLGSLRLLPQLFYRRIDGYIQGVPSTNGTANTVSTMMTGLPTLQFSSTDAEIWGMDLAWSLPLGDRLSLDGIATLARGRRVDVSDNLYRLAPLNGSIGLTYVEESWEIDARLAAYDSQKDVASFNDEPSSAGYAIVDAGAAWMPTSSLRLEARISNLFDKTYQEHLAGINRAGGSDIAIGSRLYGPERAVSVGIIYSF